ncbi:hypothetical protein UFOVP9_49 [uncultured Caudovirales phage]|uniref:Portal protein n=1 Tax=uncultured Caudovirales phage TaxID=2100421 RepID=A0A6J5KIA8_9CAUD|nr:hypothetical protein UFOVP9_49 [uncultured Caudovirales phage]
MTNWRFFVGDQTLWNDLYGNVPSNQNFQFSFNLIRPTINMISGQQRKQRKSIVAIPIENADNETSDQFSKVINWVVNQEAMLETISDAFEGALVGGMNLLQIWLDFRSDPVSGNIKLNNCQYNEYLIDPFFRKKDLSDCNYLWKRSFMTKREVLSLIPDQEDAIMSLTPNGSGTGRDGLFQFAPESYNLNQQALLTYDEYWYRDYRSQQMMIDTETGETLEWKADDAEGLAQFMAIYPQVIMVESDIPTTRLAIAVQGRILYDGPNPMGIDQYPFVPVVAYYNPQLPYLSFRLQGMVTGLRDAQYLYNRSKVLELKVKESQVNSGWKYKENALVNPKDIFLSGEGRGIALKSTANMTDVEKIQAAVIPPSWAEQTKELGLEIARLSGVNEELMGSAIDDKAGVLSMLRQRAGLVTLEGLFDNLDASQKLVGKIIIDVIQANFTPGKIQKILEGEQPTQQFYNKAFGKYHADVQDGLNTGTQRQMQFAQMLQLKEMGVPISPADLLEAATLTNKERVIKNIEMAEKRQAEMQQRQDEMTMQVQQAEIQLAQARSQADMGLWAERTSRVQDNRAISVQKLSEANKDDQLAKIHQLHLLKDLDGKDLEHLRQAIELRNLYNSPTEKSQVAPSK